MVLGATVLVCVQYEKAHAAAAVCALYCDTRDPSLARQESFPAPSKVRNGRRIELHVSDADAMAWAQHRRRRDRRRGVARPVLGRRRHLGRAARQGQRSRGTWTGTRTLMYNISDPRTTGGAWSAPAATPPG